MAAGIDIDIHQLRHSHATELINAGVSIEVARKRPGHASTETTRVYTLLADKVRRRRDPLRPPPIPGNQSPVRQMVDGDEGPGGSVARGIQAPCGGLRQSPVEPWTAAMVVGYSLPDSRPALPSSANSVRPPTTGPAGRLTTDAAGSMLVVVAIERGGVAGSRLTGRVCAQ
ncbi:tyrosine-type recombinase/integrase [Nocardia amamiensis]|uniref:tyrosine-type recombinase/integrase n=1 Tax=Nocardia amamiensis TaxID=404578 RepID=UPI0033C2F966